MYFIILSNRYLKKFHYKIIFTIYVSYYYRKYDKILLKDNDLLSLSLLSFRTTEVE